jgi:hypothetical protein
VTPAGVRWELAVTAVVQHCCPRSAPVIRQAANPDFWLLLPQSTLIVVASLLPFPPYTFIAVGEYAQVTDSNHQTFNFVFAKLDGPIIDFEFAILRGLRIGFGYNSIVRSPAVEELVNFPLIDNGAYADPRKDGRRTESMGATQKRQLLACIWLHYQLFRVWSAQRPWHWYNSATRDAFSASLAIYPLIHTFCLPGLLKLN